MLSEDFLKRMQAEVNDGYDIDAGNVDELLQELTRLQDAINEYCETRNHWSKHENHTPHGEAIDKLYEISRESGYRRRVRATSEVER